MKKLYLLSLPLAVALVLPAAAQQNSNGSNDQQPQASQTQPTPPSQQASDQQAATGKEPLKYEKHEGFWGHLNPFARKKYVNRQLDPIRGRVNELDELTAKNSRMIADVDTRATEGIRQAMSKANDADSHAVDAGNRANQAQQTAQQATTKIGNVEQVVTKLDQYQPVTQAEIRFRPGQAVLSKNAKDALDEMANTLKDQRGYVLEVQGFSTTRGAAGIESSRQLAQTVVRYLVLNHEVPVYRIYTVGMGNAPVPTEGNTEGKATHTRGGRVEISLLKNGVGDLAAGNPSNQSTTPATNVTPASQEPQGNTGASTDKPSPSTSKPPVR
jgi:outer membrane protein OmpA-like peptidoglycan-associated protein